MGSFLCWDLGFLTCSCEDASLGATCGLYSTPERDSLGLKGQHSPAKTIHSWVFVKLRESHVYVQLRFAHLDTHPKPILTS